MTIELNDKSYIVGIWFSSNPITENNWLSCAIKDPENLNRYKVWSRFRYVKDDKVFDSGDQKNWTTFFSQEGQTDDDIIAFMELAQSEIYDGYPEKDQIIVKGDLKKLMQLSKGKSWMFMKTIKANQ